MGHSFHDAEMSPVSRDLDARRIGNKAGQLSASGVNPEVFPGYPTTSREQLIPGVRERREIGETNG